MEFNNKNYTSDLIDISGLCISNNVNEIICKHPYWMQMNISKTLVIPEKKPDIEEINSLNISVDILRKKVVKTPFSQLNINSSYIPNFEGKISTGRKLIIEGLLCIKVSYTAKDITQSIHSAHFYIPFSSYIIIPLTVDFLNNDNNIKAFVDSLNINYEIDSCIEDVSINLLNPRTISKQIIILLYAIPKQSV